MLSTIFDTIGNHTIDMKLPKKTKHISGMSRSEKRLSRLNSFHVNALLFQDCLSNIVAVKTFTVQRSGVKWDALLHEILGS